MLLWEGYITASSRLAVPATLCGEAGWCAPAWREPARSSCDTPTSASPMPIVTPRARRHSSRRAPKRSRSHSRCIGCKRPTGSSARCTASSPRCPRRPTTGSSTRRWTIASARGPSAQSGPSVAPAGALQLMPAAGSRLPLIACSSLAIHTLHIQRVHSACTLHPCCQARGGSGARPTARPRRCPGARGGADVRACRGARARAGAARRPGGAAPCQKQAGTGCGQLALRRLLSAPEHASGCPELRPASPTSRLGRAGTQALSALRVDTQVVRCTERVLARLPLLLARLHGCVGTVYVHEVCRAPRRPQ